VLDREHIVPSNVTDQLLLWEAERYRIQADDTVLLEFSTIRNMNKTHFNNIFIYAEKLKILLWGDHSKMMLAVKPEGVEYVQSYTEDILG
jgi:D-lyxose ketol-isomerase